VERVGTYVYADEPGRRASSHALKQAVRNLIEKYLGRWGYELKEIGSPLRGFRASLEYAKSRGLSPRTVFDVGVGRGTPWLYEAFPDSKLVLFEPLVVFAENLTALARRYHADVHAVALGLEAGTAEINLNTAFPTSSSLLKIDGRFADFAAKVQAHHRFDSQVVVVETLDRLNSYEPPFLLKMDIEGSEMSALQGAKQTLEQTEFLILEMSVMRRLSGEPTFAEMIAFLDRCGFALYDIPCIAQTNSVAQLIYLDAAFVKRDSSLWPS
jgi:FkbM family methyltransferase